MNFGCGYREVVLDIQVMDRKRRTIALFPLCYMYLIPRDPFKLSISSDGRTRVHVPIMELLKRFCKHSDVRPRRKVSRLKFNLNVAYQVNLKE